jgi:AcrR family transcriptional regulator
LVENSVIAKHGYYAVGMEDIAAAADIGRATLYRYFSTKHKILGELTRRAVLETEQHAAALHHMAQEQFDPDGFAAWMEGYVRFHRAYRGVIRAWFDGTVAEQLSDATVSHGVGSMYQAVSALLDRATLPPGMDPVVAAAVFLAVLGRMTEPTSTRNGGDRGQRAADLMVRLLRRSVLRFG